MLDTGLSATVDSYYAYVVGQMAKYAAGQKFGGLIDARDWPQSKPMFGALYLLYLSSTPMRQSTESQVLYDHLCQWTWIVVGTDLTGTNMGQNRGDRRRQNMVIEQNLRQASYPGFCQKLNYGVPAASGAMVGVPFDSNDRVWWTKPQMMPRQDNDKTGLIYGAATVRVSAWVEIDPSLA